MAAEPFTALKLSDTHVWRFDGRRWWLHILYGEAPDTPLRPASRFEAELLNAAKREVDAVKDIKLTSGDALRFAAEELLQRLYKEYPEKLPFYCRDAASQLDAALHPEVFNPDSVTPVRMKFGKRDDEADRAQRALGVGEAPAPRVWMRKQDLETVMREGEATVYMAHCDKPGEEWVQVHAYGVMAAPAPFAGWSREQIVQLCEALEAIDMVNGNKAPRVAAMHLRVLVATYGVPGTSTAEPSLGHSTPEVCNGCGAIESHGEAHNATCGVPAVDPAFRHAPNCGVRFATAGECTCGVMEDGRHRGDDRSNADISGGIDV